MAVLKLNLPEGELPVTGKQITFVAPCSSGEFSRIVVRDSPFDLVDSLGELVTANSFAEGSMISVTLNCDTNQAFIQNAGSTAYIEREKQNHLDDKKNPHSVTKSQVGLDKVPNVATDDQTPSYTQSSTLTALTSGEKLSTAFGKIAKAIAEFISHKANKDNPHGITASQIGAAPAHTYGTEDIEPGSASTEPEGTLHLIIE